MILIKGARVLDPASGADRIADIEIDQGKITKIGEIESTDGYEQVIDAAGKVAAPGFVDPHVHFRDPGFTEKEDIITGAKAAAAGGYTTVVCMANTKPVADSAETVSYIVQKGKKTGIHVLASGAISKGFAGNELTDMKALQDAGAVGFTDDGIALQNSGLVRQAMRIAKQLDVPLSFHEEDPSLIGCHGINEGKISEKLGVSAAPAVAEEVMIARDCMLALETGARVNIQHVSAKNSVELIRLAKKLGADVWAEVTPHHFSLTEEALLSKGTLVKVNPPIRTEADRLALIAGLNDGTLDMIATDHAPHTKADKEKEMQKAMSGMTGLETALSVGITYLVRPGHLSLMELIGKMTLGPASLYRLDAGKIEIGGKADLVIFDENMQWVPETFCSKSTNSPYQGEELYGRILYTICEGKLVFS